MTAQRAELQKESRSVLRARIQALRIVSLRQHRISGCGRESSTRLPKARELRDASGNAENASRDRLACAAISKSNNCSPRADDEAASQESSSSPHPTPAGEDTLHRQEVPLPGPLTNEPAAKTRRDGHLRGEGFTRSETSGHGRCFMRGDGARCFRENKS